MDPWHSFDQGQVDIILWPGYWGWEKGDSWQEFKKDGEINLVYRNMNLWQRPLIQANYAFNDLSDSRNLGPHGMSMFIQSDNSLSGMGDFNLEACYKVEVEEKQILRWEKVGDL